MTLAEIRTQVRKRLGETTSAFWTDAELNTYINLGLKDLSWRTKCLRANGSFGAISCESSTVSAKSNEYTVSSVLSEDCYAITEAYFKVDGEDFDRLIPTNRADLDTLSPGWQSLVGYTYTNTASGVITYNYESICSTPTHYYWDREEDIFGLYPPPNDDQAGSNYIKCYYTYTHTNLSSDSATPTIPEPLHMAAVDFSVASGFEDRGWGDRANDFWNKYFKKVSEYDVERKNEREDEEIIMKGYRNI